MFPQAISHGGRGPCVDESSTSASVLGRHRPLHLHSYLHFGPWGRTSDGGPKRPGWLVSAREAVVLCYIWGTLTPCSCAPKHKNATFIFQIIWLQGSTQTTNGTNKNTLLSTTERRTFEAGAAFQQAQSWKGHFNGGRNIIKKKREKRTIYNPKSHILDWHWLQLLILHILQ